MPKRFVFPTQDTVVSARNLRQSQKRMSSFKCPDVGSSKMFATANLSTSAKELRLNWTTALSALKYTLQFHCQLWCSESHRTNLSWSSTLVCNIGTKKAVLLCQSCILSHAVEDSSLRYKVCRSIKLCYLSLVQHQHSARRERGKWFTKPES